MAKYATPQAANSSNDKHTSATSSNGLKIVEQKPGVLFTSSGGVSFPIEICLKIVEEVVSWDPKVGPWTVKAVSKQFNSLLRTYEQSIVKRVSKNETTVNYPDILLSSWPRNACIVARSFTWLCEVRCRTHTIFSLINHEITSMISSSGNRIAIDLPLPDVPGSELLVLIERFKMDALDLLYRIADSTAAVSNTDIHTLRAHQVSFLKSLSTTALAVLGVFIRVLGLGYFRMTKSSHPNKTSDSIRDRWIVFEDRILRYGPFLALAIAAPATRSIHQWSNDVISDALVDMEAFETGKTQGYASLQSVLWKIFCARKECDMFDSWEEAKEMVEMEMLSYGSE